MGKKGKQHGGSTSSGFVVVNPMLLQTVMTSNSKKRKSNDNTVKPQKHKKQKRVITAENSTHPNKSSDSEQQRVEVTISRVEDTPASLYWILLTRENKQSCVILLTKSAQRLFISPQHIAGILKTLGLPALSIHNKMSGAQRKQAIQRLRDSSVKNPCLVVTNEHFIGCTSSKTADIIILGTASAATTSALEKYARVYTMSTEPSKDFIPYTLTLPTKTIVQLQARWKLASQIVETTQRISNMSNTPDHADTKWAKKLAKEADLSEDDEHIKPKTSVQTAEHQRVTALTSKLVMLLARSLDSDDSTQPHKVRKDNQHSTEKLALLGLLTTNASIGTSINGDERLSAQTQWLDEARGIEYGGDWSTSIRHGASKDNSSLALRVRVVSSRSKVDTLLHQWHPNEHPSDLNTWGGLYGKVCGHNEVVMHTIRPFAPQMVLNARVCSRRHPASGNQGFDGCLEFLRLSCMEQKKCMTVWDAEHFLWFGRTGVVRGMKKNGLLDLPLASLQCVLASLKHWTLACNGQHTANTLLLSIRFCCNVLGNDVSKDKHRIKCLHEAAIRKRILMFAIGGSQRVWKQLQTHLILPLEAEVLYQ